MPRIQSINTENADGRARELLNHIQTKMGMTPNMMRSMANSPAVLQAYLGFGEALAKGALSSKLREKIALAVSEANGCGYCLAAHSAIGHTVGLSKEEIFDSRRSYSVNRNDNVVLKFVRKLVDKRGVVDDNDVSILRDAGFGDGEIAEIIANVTHSIFTNYFNHVAEPDVDFPPIRALVSGRVVSH